MPISNLDIAFGVLAWLIAIGSHVYVYLFPADTDTYLWNYALHHNLVMTLWFAAMITAFSLRHRPLKQMLWVWLSAPIAFAWPVLRTVVWLEELNLTVKLPN